MRLAFSLSGHRDAAGAIRAARLAEEAGFADVWLTEDYCERGAFALAGAVAAATSRVRVGIGVVNPWTRHPVLLAMEFATLDEISGGRAVLGLGASNQHWMSDQLGIPFRRPLARTLEATALIRAMLRGEQVSFHGEFFDVETGLAFTPARTDPPVVLGVKGPRAVASVAAAEVDGVLLSFLVGPEYVRWVRDTVGNGVELSAYVGLAVGASAAEARDRVRPTVARFLGVHGDHLITRLAGVEPDLAARFRAGFLAGTPRTELVTDDLLERVVAAGTVDDAAAALTRLDDAGLDVVVVRDDPDVDPAEIIRITTDTASTARRYGRPGRPASR